VQQITLWRSALALRFKYPFPDENYREEMFEERLLAKSGTDQPPLK
jgi:hypothetical protein